MHTDEAIYEAVAFELEREGPRKGLWAKAFAKAEGAESTAKALYIEWRVEQLKQALAAELARAEAAAKKQAEFEAEATRLREDEENVLLHHPKFVGLARKFLALGLSTDVVKMQLETRGLPSHLTESVLREAAKR